MIDISKVHYSKSQLATAQMSRPEIGLQIKSVNDEKDPIRTVVPRSRGIGVKF